MSKKFARAQKVTAIVPLAVLSVAWTASLAGVGTPGLSASAAREGGGPPAPTIEVPSEALQGGGSVLGDDAVDAMGSVTTRGGLAQISSTASTSAIPAAALAAYQRAESIINAADESCGLPWQIIAAIGRVESDHGRFGGSALDTDGVAQPDIVGVALDGTKQTSRIPDTDGGRYDGDTEFDRAIGPMQFIPDTWASIGVDADNDGQRNPQDIDDAALGTAVYLCSGEGDLSTLTGQRDALLRYNNSEAYVDLVLAIAASYLDGDFSSVPNNTVAAGVLTPIPTPFSARLGQAGATGPGSPGYVEDEDREGAPRSANGGGGSTDDGGGSTPPQAEEPPAAPPTGGDDGDNGSTGGSTGNTVKNTAKNGGKTVKNTVKGAVKGGGQAVGGAVQGGGQTVETTLSYAEARAKCLGELGLTGGLLGLTAAQQSQLDGCIAKYT